MRGIKNTFGILLLTVFVFQACSPKVAEEVKEVVEEPVKVETPQEPENPCMTLSKLSPADRDEAETAYVLYKDQVKQNNFEAALPLWKKAYGLAPAANGSIKYQYEDGIKIYKSFYEKTMDNALKQSYLDTIMSIYDKRVECFPADETTVKARKGFDYYYYYSAHAPAGKSYQLFKDVIDSKGEKTDYYVVNPFTKMLFDKLVNKEISVAEGEKYAMKLWDILDYGTNSGKNKDAWAIVNDYAPSRLESLEGIEGLYGCEYYTDKYYPGFEANPTDCDAINLAIRRMLRGNCDPNNEKLKALNQAKAQHCKVVVSAGPLKTAFDTYQAGRIKEAIVQFEDFVNTTTDIDKKAKYTLLIAKIYYGDLKNFPKARTYAEKAASIKGNWGDPYLLIGKLYASSGPLCGPGRGWDSQIVTWPAIDMFTKAKNVDPSVAAEANKWIGQYRQYMPNTEDIFSRGIKEGSSYKVGCWINRSTTVRVSD